MPSIGLSFLPEQFDLTYHIMNHGNQPMNEIALYMNILAVMYDLSFKRISSNIPNFQSWSLPQYNVQILVKADEARYAVWGLFASFFRNEGFYPMATDLLWDGQEAGQVIIAYRNQVASTNGSVKETDPYSLSVKSTETIMQVNVSSQSVQEPPAGMRYNLNPNGHRIAARALFALTFRALTCTFHLGFRAPFPGYRHVDRALHYTFRFTVLYDDDGVSRMAARDMTRLMTFIASDMVETNKFEGFEIEVMRDEEKIGYGYLIAN